MNPGFFNYPSLSFYVHFLVQGVVYAFLKLAGTIGSATDWYVSYLTDPTIQFVASRLVGVVFGTLTVCFTFATAKSITGSRLALLSG